MDHDRSIEALGRAADANDVLRAVLVSDGVVARPASDSTATVFDLLRHLRAKGLTCVPRPLEVRDGVERLELIEGESGGRGWFHQHDDRGLGSAARLLRLIHDAGADWSPPADATWNGLPIDGPDRVYCHGDPGPWNFVWRDGEAVGLIDWDYLHPAPRLDDVAYALRWFVPFRSDEMARDWHHFPAVPDRRHRTQVFLDAYGDLPPFEVVDAVVERMTATCDLMRSLAQRGVEPQRTWVAEGALDVELAEIEWVLRHGHH